MKIQSKANLETTDLYKDVSERVKSWIPDGNTKISYLRKLVMEEDHLKMSKVQKYELSVYYWCRTFSSVFSRLSQIQNMTTRQLYMRKGERKAQILKDWMVYNYHIYVAVYQSILDISLLFSNVVLDLGLLPTQCRFDTLVKNKRIKESDISKELKAINRTTETHRLAKNTLLHQGKGTRPRLENRKYSSFDIDILTKHLSFDEKEFEDFEEFLAIKDQDDLSNQMKEECENLKKQVASLLSQSYRCYQQIDAFYQTMTNGISRNFPT